MLALALLGACLQSEARVGPDEGEGRVVEVDVIARVDRPGQPAAWTARARQGPPAPEGDPIPPGVCRKAAPEVVPPGERFAEEVRVTGPTGTSLDWDDERGVYVATGPRRTADPAWVVGDVQWRDADGRLRIAEGVVRFGAQPEVTVVERDPEGGVQLRWDPETVGHVQVLANGPAGPLVCAADGAGIDLPWWAVPPRGGSVLLRSTHERGAVFEGDDRVRVRSTLERVVPLDVPDTSSAHEEPVPAPAPTPGIRRATRTAKSPLG